jgi:hypothetical protein
MPQQKSSISLLKEKAASHIQQAKEIQSKIKELEDERYLKIGKLTADFQKKDWAGFELSLFKKNITDILAS